MMDDLAGSALCIGHFQRLQHQLTAQMILHRPTDYATTEGIDHHGQIQEAGPGGNVGVSSPEESHPQALAEPDVNLSAHPAPIIEPQLQDRLASAQTDSVVGARGAQPIGAPGVDRAAF